MGRSYTPGKDDLVSYEEHRTCKRKTKYQSRRAAEKKLERDRDMYHPLTAPYRCPYCKTWHLGAPSGMKKRYDKERADGQEKTGT